MNSEIELSANEREVWRAFLRGTALVQEQLNQDLARSVGLSINEYEVLAALDEAPDHRKRMSRLAEELMHSRSRLTHTVRRLEHEGFVKRIKCDDDGRGIYCALTKSGRLKFESAAEVQVSAVRERLLSKFSDAEMDQIGTFFRRLLDGADGESKLLDGAGSITVTGDGDGECALSTEEPACECDYAQMPEEHC